MALKTFRLGTGLVAVALVAGSMSGCGGGDKHKGGNGGAGGASDGGQPDATGGGGGTGGTAGSGGGGSGGTGGTAGNGGAGGMPDAGGDASLPELACGSATCKTLVGNIQGFPVVLSPCCSDNTRCGVDLAPLAAAGAVVPSGCTELDQPGNADDTCPAEGSDAGPALPGCCLPSGRCGVTANFGVLRLGCVDPVDYGVQRDGGAMACVPSGPDGGAEGGAAGDAGDGGPGPDAGNVDAGPSTDASLDSGGSDSGMEPDASADGAVSDASMDASMD